MLTGIREKAFVKENGTIEVSAPDLPIGKEVEVIILVEEEEIDTTEYLLSSEANREHLLQAIRDAKNPEKLTYVNVDEL